MSSVLPGGLNFDNPWLFFTVIYYTECKSMQSTTIVVSVRSLIDRDGHMKVDGTLFPSFDSRSDSDRIHVL